MTPFLFMDKEIERKGQEGEDISIIENSGPMTYSARRTKNTYAADPALIVRARRFPLRKLIGTSGASQHAVERFLEGHRLFPKTRARMINALLKLERQSSRKV